MILTICFSLGELCISDYALVNYHSAKAEVASCFSDGAIAPSPQALIPTVPAVFLMLVNYPLP